jgi:hypothetical protein
VDPFTAVFQPRNTFAKFNGSVGHDPHGRPDAVCQQLILLGNVFPLPVRDFCVAVVGFLVEVLRSSYFFPSLFSSESLDFSAKLASPHVEVT